MFRYFNPLEDELVYFSSCNKISLKYQNQRCASSSFSTSCLWPPGSEPVGSPLKTYKSENVSQIYSLRNFLQTCGRCSFKQNVTQSGGNGAFVFIAYFNSLMWQSSEYLSLPVYNDGRSDVWCQPLVSLEPAVAAFGWWWRHLFRLEPGAFR